MANQPTPPSGAPTTLSERWYAELSEAAKERVLREVKALQDDPRTTWLKKGEDRPAHSFFTREHGPVTPPRNPSDPF